MGYTKLQFIEEAYEEIGLPSYLFQSSPERLQSALRKLDSMLATWNAQGIRIGFPIPADPESSELATETGAPDSANEAIRTNLALSIAPSFGKVVSIETKIAARRSYNALLALHSYIPERQLPGTMPMGAGNRRRGTCRNYFPTPSEPVTTGQDAKPLFET